MQHQQLSRAKYSFLVFMCSHVRAIWTNKTMHFVELQKLYLTNMFKDFHNKTLSHNVSITFALNFQKPCFFTEVFNFLEECM